MPRSRRTVEEELQIGARYREAYAKTIPTLDEEINARRTPLRYRQPKQSLHSIPSSEDPYKLTREYKTVKEVFLERAEKKCQKQKKKKRKKKIKRYIIREEPHYEPTEYEKWYRDPTLYRKEQEKKKKLKQQKLEKEAKERQLLLNQDFLEEEEFSFLTAISITLTATYYQRRSKKIRKQLRISAKLKNMVKYRDPRKPLTKRMKYYMKILGLNSDFRVSKKNKSKKPAKKSNVQDDIHIKVAASGRPIPFDEILNIQKPDKPKKKLKPKKKSKRCPEMCMLPKKPKSCPKEDGDKPENSKKKSKKASCRQQPNVSNDNRKTTKPKKKKKKKVRRTNNRDLMTQRQYDNFLATPRKLPQPPKEKPKPSPLFTMCSKRMEQLSRPKKSLVCENLKQYKNTLPLRSIEYMQKIMDEPPVESQPDDIITADRKFRQLEKRQEKEEKARQWNILKPYRKFMKYESALLADAMCMMLTKASPREFNGYRMSLAAKAFDVARKVYNVKVKKPNRNTKKLGKKVLLNAGDVVGTWIDVTWRKGDELTPRAWYPKKTTAGKEKRRVRLPPVFTVSERSPPSSAFWSESYQGSYEEDAASRASRLFQGMLKHKQETLIEIILRILRSGDRKPLEQEIHERYLANHTYKELAAKLQEMLLKKIILEDVEKPNDLVDAELEETLMTWAFNNREPLIGIHEETAIKKFSKHLLGLFGIDKEQMLAEEARRKRDESDAHMSAIIEGEEESGAEGIGENAYDYKMILPHYDYKTLEYRPGSEVEGGEGGTQYTESEYGIAGADTLSDKSFSSEEGEGGSLSERWEAIMRERLAEMERKELEEMKSASGKEAEGAEEEFLASSKYWGDELPDDVAEEELPEEFEGQYVPGDVIALEHPSSIHDHTPQTVCCITIRKFAEWIYNQATFLEQWSRMYGKCLQAMRKFTDYKLEHGIEHEDDMEQFSELENILNGMMDTLKQFRDYIDSVGTSVYESFHGKEVQCCAKCLEENRLPEIDDDPAHDQMNALILSIQEMEKYHGMLENWLDPNEIIEELCEAMKEQVLERRRKEKQKKRAQVVSLFEIAEMPSDSSMETQYGDIEEL